MTNLLLARASSKIEIVSSARISPKSLNCKLLTSLGTAFFSSLSSYNRFRACGFSLRTIFDKNILCRRQSIYPRQSLLNKKTNIFWPTNRLASFKSKSPTGRFPSAHSGRSSRTAFLS